MIYTIISINQKIEPHVEVRNGPPDESNAYALFKAEYEITHPENMILLLVKGDHATRSYIPGVCNNGIPGKDLYSNLC
tara:strand:+ start:2380 stop:2613 length:234 start_codon:yes stop_codon:yes gene_type:complete